jgi:hypothetical protein
MHKRRRLSILSVLVLAVALGLGVYWLQPPRVAWAANSSLYLAPVSQTVTANDTIVVTIKVNTGNDPVNAVQANLSYPMAIFDSVSIASTAQFDVVAENTASGGIIRIARGASTPIVGIADVAVITFHTFSSGTPAINFTSGSMIVRSTDNVNTLSATTGGNYTVNNPAPPPTTPSCNKGDLNCDRKINALDLGTVLSRYGTTTSTGDVNADGKVNALDLGYILSVYGTTY